MSLLHDVEVHKPWRATFDAKEFEARIIEQMIMIIASTPIEAFGKELLGSDKT